MDDFHLCRQCSYRINPPYDYQIKDENVAYDRIFFCCGMCREHFKKDRRQNRMVELERQISDTNDDLARMNNEFKELSYTTST